MAINIEVTAKKVTITSIDMINKGEYNINDCIFTFSNEYENLIKRAVFTNGLEKSYVVEIEDNRCMIPEEILSLYGKCILGVYGYANSENTLQLRYSPIPTSFNIDKGSYIQDAQNFIPAKPVKDLIDEYNINAVNKTNEFNQNAIQKTQDFNQNAIQQTDEFNNNAIQKAEGINNIAAQRTTEFNQNAVEKTTEFNINAQNKTGDFDNNAIEKRNQFNENAQNRTNELNQIAEGIEDMTTAIQFATFEVDNNMGLYIVQADRLINTNFIFDQETGGLEVMIV